VLLPVVDAATGLAVDEAGYDWDPSLSTFESLEPCNSLPDGPVDSGALGRRPDECYNSPVLTDVSCIPGQTSEPDPSANGTGQYAAGSTCWDVSTSEEPMKEPAPPCFSQGNAMALFQPRAEAARSVKDESDQDSWYQNGYSKGKSRKPFILDRALSPFTSQLLSEDYNRMNIKKGLMKIYHDSMEGALSCWLTERNCPYSSVGFDGREVWSSNWANRIVKRVCDLDKAFSATGSLSATDQRQASKVLNLVVMAFASQWSQTGRESVSRSSSSPSGKSSRRDSPSSIDLEGSDDEVFGRSMQQSLWHRANKALLEASENMSFRVILAGIIFSLTQRPMGQADVEKYDSSNENNLAQLLKVLDHDGPTITLDIALRKLHDHQRRLEDSGNAPTDSFGPSPPPPKLSGDHKQTFGLLYWLAVMFDTISAAINRRSFTVSDQDTHFNCEPGSAPDPPPTIDLDGWSDQSSKEKHPLDSGVDLWGDYFLHQQSRVGDVRKGNTRWPCSYIDAAACLADAAPVKVLLFRRIGQLQSLFYRRSSAQDLEKGIEAAMSVYNHWNNSYGRFIEDCIQHHEDLPARIQSWYILLAGHWNLGVLILSDLIRKMDDSRRTLPGNRRSRLSTDFAGMHRSRAAFTVSELGRCSRQRVDEDLTFSQSPDFHHAVNKAALLTEPWTMVLVRAFGYAGAVLARQAASQTSTMSSFGNPGCVVGAAERLQYCIDALFVLGRKSDMALCAAQVLQRAAVGLGPAVGGSVPYAETFANCGF
jgi:hypothetical protein